MGQAYAVNPGDGERPLPAEARVVRAHDGHVYPRCSRVEFEGDGPEGTAAVRFRPPSASGRMGAEDPPEREEVVAVRLELPPAARPSPGAGEKPAPKKSAAPKKGENPAAFD